MIWYKFYPLRKANIFDANYCNKCIFLVPSIKCLSWLRRGRREWSFRARIFLVLVIFLDVVSAVLIGDVCSPEFMKIFKTLFPKLQNGHVVGAYACAAWHVCVTAFSKRTWVLLTDLTVHHVSFLHSILHLARAKSEALVNICSFSNKTANKSIGLISQKNNFARTAHLFVHFFGVVLHDYNLKLPETFGLDTQRFMEEMSCVFVFAFFSLPAHFIISPWWPLEFFIFAPPL